MPLLRSKFVNIFLDYSFFIFYAPYIIASYLFNRAGYSFIPNALLILIYVTTIIRIIIRKQKLLNTCTCFVLCLLPFVAISSILSVTIPYKFLILLANMVCAYFACQNIDCNIKSFITFRAFFCSFTLLVMIFYYFLYNRNVFAIRELGRDGFFLNQDGFSSFGADVFICSALLLKYAMFSKKQFYIRLVFFTFLLFSMSLGIATIFFTDRLGGLIRIIIFLILYFYYSFRKRKVFLLVISLSIIIFLILFFSIDLSSLPSVNRIKILVVQLFNTRKNYDSSIRIRVIMLLRDIRYAFSYPIFGPGYNKYLDINTDYGHNAFACVSNSFGLMSILLYLIIIILIIVQCKKQNFIGKDIIICYFLMSTLFSWVYGMAFSDRNYYFIFGSVIYATFKNSSFENKISKMIKIKWRKN